MSLLCDVVVELDASQTLRRHQPKLAGLLIMDRQSSTEGLLFQSFMPNPGDRTAFEEQLSRTSRVDGRPFTSPGSLSVTLRDTSGCTFSVDLFYVQFVGLDKCKHYYVGLRE